MALLELDAWLGVGAVADVTRAFDVDLIDDGMFFLELCVALSSALRESVSRWKYTNAFG